MAASTGNWPHWRGPKDDGNAGSGNYPIEWDSSHNVLWKASLPGKGCSTPIVWDRHIYVTAPSEGQNALLSFDWSGKLLWTKKLGAERAGKNAHGSGSNPSPVTDGKAVFVYFKSGDFAALNLDGTIRWQKNLVEEYGRDNLFWDYGTSPVLTEKDVVIARMQHGESYLAAFDKVTGAVHWKVARNFTTPSEGDHSYASPIVVRQRGKEIIVTLGGEHLTSNDAKDGTQLWSCGDFNPQAKPNWVTVGSPVITGEMAVIPYGRGIRLHGIKLEGSGDVTTTARAWLREDTGAFVSTPAASGGHVYLLHDHGADRGTLECIEPKTGKTLCKGELPRGSSEYYASPIVANGKIYAAREDGVVFVARCDEKFELLASNTLGETIVASPVPVDNRLLIRGEQNLFCIGSK